MSDAGGESPPPAPPGPPAGRQSRYQMVAEGHLPEPVLDVSIKRHLFFWLAAIAAFFLCLYLFSGILLPFVAGMATAYFLDPVCDRLESWGLSRTLATVVVTLIFIVVLVAILLVLVPALAGQIGGLLERLPQYFETVRTTLLHFVESMQARLDPELIERAREVAVGSLDRFVSWVTTTIGNLVSGGVALANFLSLVVITPIVAFYLLRDWDRIVDRVDGWLPRAHADTIREQFREVDRILAGFVRGQASVCLILAAFYAVGLTLCGLEFGLAIGLFAGLISFVPYLGSLTGGLVSIGLALIQFDSWFDIGAVAVVFVVGQAIEGNFLTPLLVGDKVGLHPVWVIFALLAGGALFGFVGVLIALPVAAAIGVLVRFGLSRYLASDFYHGPGGSPPTGRPASDSDA